MPLLVFQRCQYVVKEIARVEAACKDLERHDLAAFGQKMFETHLGLSHYYEVSCPELDFLVKRAKKNEAVFGSRMMGGGFGGCTINLIKTAAIPQFIEDMKAAYFKKFKIDLKTYVVTISNGTTRLDA